MSSYLVVLFCLALQGCEPPTRESPAREHHSPEALADSLIYAAREFCVPYVVDGASAARLAQRPGVSEQHTNVHGKDVTFYRLDQPGFPEVTPDEQDYCRVELEVPQSSDRLAVVAAFARNLQLDGRDTSQPHYVHLPGIGPAPKSERSPNFGPSPNVMCVHGKSDALISISNPDPQYPISVYVRSDPEITSRLSCIAGEPRSGSSR
jgi:hypothetical protein